MDKRSDAGQHTLRSCIYTSVVACCTLLLMASCRPEAVSVRTEILSQAHAHNDYMHEHPLQDALSHGFNSVEADIFLVDDDLYVAHNREDIKPERTLRALYLDPLRERAKQNNGRIHPGKPPLTLLIDLKSDAESTYRRLDRMLAEYSDIFSSFGPTECHNRAIIAIVSGNRPFELMQSQEIRYAAYDGRLSDLDSDAPAHLIAMISDNWGKHFTWRGEGDMPVEERQKLHDIVYKAHSAGRTVRFWGAPDRPSPARDALWNELVSAGVDFLNTDDLAGMQQYLKALQNEPNSGE